MADSMDLVQQRVEENLQRHIQNARANSSQTSYPGCAVLRDLSGNC